MKKIKKTLLVTTFLFMSLIVPRTTQAFDIRVVFNSGDSTIVRIRDKVEYFFTFGVEKKVKVLEKQAERQLETAENNIKNGNDSNVPSSLQNYLQIKNKQNDLLDDVDEEVMEKVEERTLGQQMTMEGMKGKIDPQTKQEMIGVQEQVVNQVAKRIVEVNGKEGQVEFFNKVEHVWAAGTGPGGEAGVIIEGGGSKFAPGTSAGSGGGVQYAGGTGPVIVITGGVETPNDTKSTTPGGFAPGTSGGAPNDVVVTNGEIKFSPGTSEHGESWLAP